MIINLKETALHNDSEKADECITGSTLRQNRTARTGKKHLCERDRTPALFLPNEVMPS